MLTSKENGPMQPGVAVSVQVSRGLTVQVIPNPSHVFLMTTKQVAAGYGISDATIRSHKRHLIDEFIEGTHFLKGVQNLHSDSDEGVTKCHTLIDVQPHQIFWTKSGVIRLGFFIKSERAKLFRDWAEQVILNAISTPSPVLALPQAAKRKHNRITPARLNDILADVCLIEDKTLRLRIMQKLMGERSFGDA